MSTMRVPGTSSSVDPQACGPGGLPMGGVALPRGRKPTVGLLRSRRTYRLAALAVLVAGVVLQSAPPADASGSHSPWSAPKLLHGASTVGLGSATSENPYLSCSAPGDCSAAGTYQDNNFNTRSYLDSEVNGVWRPASDVGGVAVGANQVQITGLSCVAGGNCLAIGTYATPAQEAQIFFGNGTPFLDKEVDGVWQPAINPPGLASLDASYRYTSVLDDVSCASAGNCAAAGTFFSNATYPAFVVDETNGKWSKATELSLKAAGLSRTGLLEAPVDALSCVLPGDCTLGGYLSNGNNDSQGYVAQEVNGHWGAGKPVPGLKQLNDGASALVGAVSCSSPGNCGVGGTYADGDDAPQAFVADEVHGVWSSAVEVPGTAALNTGGGEIPSGGGPPFGAQVQTIDCRADGDCTIVGWYETLLGASDLFVDAESGGVWATAIAMPNLATLNAGASIENNGAAAAGLACAGVGDCVIAGNYVDATGDAQLFTETQTSGTFGAATELPGSATLTPGFTDPFADSVNSLSCWDASDCALSGLDATAAGGFVNVESGGTWATPTDFVTSPTVYLGTDASVDEMSCPAAGSCAAIGSYESSSRTEEIFFSQETSGVWGADVSMSGLESLAPNGDVGLDSFRCSSVGTCTILGSYLGSGDVEQLFYDVERNGTWQTPQAVTGLPAVTKGTNPFLFEGPRWTATSCGNAASCVGVGVDLTSSTSAVPFMVTETAGAWAVTLSEPGSTLSGGPELTTVSCPSPGNCVAMGRVSGANQTQEVFTVPELSGTWGEPELLPSPAALSTAKGDLKGAYVQGLTCKNDNTCAVTGQITLAGVNSEPFVMSKVHGAWKPAEKLPGFATLAKLVPPGGYFYIGVDAPTCPTPTTCIVVGTYPVDYQQDFFGDASSFVLTSRSGVWTPLALLKNPATTKTKNSTSTYQFDVSALACVSATSCLAIGINQETTLTRVNPYTWDYTYTYAIASASGFGSSYPVPVDLTPRISSYDQAPWSIYDVSCGASGQVGTCGAGGSYDNLTSTFPFVMTAS